MRVVRWMSVGTLALACAGCPAIMADSGSGMVSPSATDRMPARADLPKAERFVDLDNTWRRSTRIGLGGSADATIEDPLLVAAAIAHDAAINGRNGADVDGMIQTRWTDLFGQQADRFAIDVSWRFDTQFVAEDTILDPGQWTITLYDGEGHHYAPLAATQLSASRVPEDNAWEGTIRLWFPWRDPQTTGKLLGGTNSSLRLVLSHPSGQGEFTWRFRSVY